MKFGLTLPQFTDSSDPSLEASIRAEKLGLDGVFAFDHLWPIGQPGRPALSALPLLAAVAGTTRRIAVGTLVARTGMLPDPVLTGELISLARIAPGRVIAGLGTGDAKSAAENDACGLGVAPRRERLASLEALANEMSAHEIPAWLGGGSPAITGIARRTGAALNLWDTTEDATAALVHEGFKVTWGGPMTDNLVDATERARALSRAGASWLVWGWPPSPDAVAQLRDASL